MPLLYYHRIAIILAVFIGLMTIAYATHPVFDGSTPLKLVIPAKLDEMQRNWFVVPLAPVEITFRPFFLPFKVQDTTKTTATDAQALTFPSLLAFKFDLIPNELLVPYANPLFVFRKYPESVNFTGTSAEAAIIAKKAGCTHIFGGTLVVTANGYAGNLFALDLEMKDVYRKSYAKPMPYFTLMGLIVDDWMQFCRQTVSEKLKIELYRPMTNNMKNVTLLSKTFSKKWRSNDEFVLFDQILKNDPDFGEIRWWTANQRGWAEQFTPNIDAEIARAFLHHPVIHAMKEFSPSNITDTQLQAQAIARWKEYYACLPDNNTLIGYKFVYGSYYIGNSFRELEQIGIPLFKVYPYNELIGYGLARSFSIGGEYQSAIPIAINAALINDPTAEFRENSLLLAAMDWWALGESGPAITCIKMAIASAGLQNLDKAVGLWLTILRSNLCFEEAVSLGMDYYQKVKGPSILMHTILAAREGGLEASVEPLISELKILDPCRLATCLLAWSELKKRVIMPEVLKDNNSNIVSMWEMQGQQRFYPDSIDIGELRIQQALLFYTKNYGTPKTVMEESGAFDMWLLMPRAPYFAQLYRQRCQSTKRPRDLYMYASVLSWLRPDERYWQQLQEEARQQGGEWNPDAQAIRTELNTGVSVKTDAFPLQNYRNMCRPLVLEYLLLNAVRINDQQLFDELYAKYKLYQGRYQVGGTMFTIHCWDFLNHIALLLPEERRKSMLDDALARLYYEQL